MTIWKIRLTWGASFLTTFYTFSQKASIKSSVIGMFVALILFLYGNGNYLPSGVTEGGFLTNDLEHSDKDLS